MYLARVLSARILHVAWIVLQLFVSVGGYQNSFSVFVSSVVSCSAGDDFIWGSSRGGYKCTGVSSITLSCLPPSHLISHVFPLPYLLLMACEPWERARIQGCIFSTRSPPPFKLLTPPSAFHSFSSFTFIKIWGVPFSAIHNTVHV